MDDDRPIRQINKGDRNFDYGCAMITTKFVKIKIPASVKRKQNIVMSVKGRGRTIKEVVSASGKIRKETKRQENRRNRLYRKENQIFIGNKMQTAVQ